MKLSAVVILALGVVFAFAGCFKKSAALKETSNGTLEGVVKPSERMGEIEFRADGTARLKAHNVEGKVLREGEQIAIMTPAATYYFTWKNGEFKQGVSDPSKKILPLHSPVPANKEAKVP
ncbi:MAG: hypothetical protein V1746_00980 [bacterium]